MNMKLLLGISIIGGVVAAAATAASNKVEGNLSVFDRMETGWRKEQANYLRGRRRATISDAAHNKAVQNFYIYAAHDEAVQHFYFLPPMVRNTTTIGVFDGSHEPTVSIWELDTNTEIALLVTEVKPDEELYEALWHTRQYDLDPKKTYQIRVLVEGHAIGYADVDVVKHGKELKNVDTDEYIPLKNGRTLPIKFRIEEGLTLCFAPPLPAVIAHWDFNDVSGGTLSDVSGNGHDGTIYGNPVAIDGVLQFDGNNDYVKIPLNEALNFPENGGSMSIVAWVNPEVPDSVVGMIIGNTCGGRTGWDMYVATNGGKHVAARYQEDTAHPVDFSEDGTWKLLVRTYDSATRKHTLYYNGQHVNEVVSAIIPPFYCGTNVRIGRESGDRFYYKGLIDDIALYNQALTPDQIRCLYENYE